MKIALAQMAMTQSMKDNYEKSMKMISMAARKGAQLVCFPELQLSPFFPQYEEAEVSRYLMTLDDDYVSGLKQACEEHHIFAALNLYIDNGAHHYDMSLLISDKGELIGTQSMVHIAQCPQFYEQSYYEPSYDGFHVFDTKLGKIGIVVCFDRHYPESVRTEALRGAELIIIPTANTTDEPARLFDYEVKVQAFQNHVPIVMVNRVGLEGNVTFSGRSLIVDQNGETVAQANHEEGLLISDIEVKQNNILSHPYLSLRRKIFYE